MEQKINLKGGLFLDLALVFGGDGGIRTPDRVIMIHLLCRLSYIALGHHEENRKGNHVARKARS